MSRPTVPRYAIAVLTTAAVAAVGLGLRSAPGDLAAFLPLTAAVLVTVWYDGQGPALAATALGALTALYLSVSPDLSLENDGPVAAEALALFLATGAAISLVTGRCALRGAATSWSRRCCARCAPTGARRSSPCRSRIPRSA